MNVPEATAPVPPALRLQQPAKWAGKVRIRTLDEAAADALVPYARKVVEYMYQPSDEALVAQPLLMVVEMSERGWALTRKMPGPELGKLLGKRDGYVYILCLPQVSPYPDDSKDKRIFSDLMLDEATATRLFGEIPGAAKAAG